MIQIPQSTTRTVMLKLFLTGTTTPATGKTLVITLSKAGGAFANPSAGATNATEMSNGWYSVALSTTDTGTLGDLIVRGTAAACDDSERLFGVVLATTGGLTALPNTAVSANASLITSGTGTAQLSLSAGKVAGVVLVDTLTTYTSNTPQTGDSFARIGNNGAGLTSLAPSATALSTAQWTNTLAANLGTLAGHDPGETLAGRTNITAGTITTVSAVTGLTASDVGAIKTKTDFLPSATAGAAGGVFIAGTNAATTVTTSFTTTFTGNLTGSVNSVATGVILAANQHVIVDSGTVTTLTNLPTAPTDWISAAAVSAAAVTKIQSGLSTYAGGDTSGVTTLLTRLPSAISLNAGAVTVGTNNDKTGYALTQAFPSNFAALGITVGGKISGVVLADTTTTLTNLPTAPTDWLTAAAVKADAVTKIQNGLATTANVASVETDTQDIQARLPASLVSGRMDVSVGTYQANQSPGEQVIYDYNSNPNNKLFVVSGGGVYVTAIGLDALSSVVTAIQTELIPQRFVMSEGKVWALDSDGNGLATGGGASADDVWNYSSRVLTSGTNIVLAKGTGITGFNDLSAAQVNAEVDTAIVDVGLTTTVTGRIDASILSRLAVASYSAPLDAVGTRNAVGLGAANLDSQLSSIKADTGSDLPAQIAGLSFSTLTADDVWTFATRTLTAGGGGATPEEIWTYTSRTLTSGGGGGGYTPEQVAAAVRDLSLVALAPNDRMVDTNGGRLTELTLGQILGALAANMLGDRSGAGTRTITASIVGNDGYQFVANRVSQSVIEMRLTVPADS